MTRMRSPISSFPSHFLHSEWGDSIEVKLLSRYSFCIGDGY